MAKDRRGKSEASLGRQARFGQRCEAATAGILYRVILWVLTKFKTLPKIHLLSQNFFTAVHNGPWP